MKRLIVSLGLLVLALPGIAQVPYIVNMGFNISFSALSNSPPPDNSIFGSAEYSRLKLWSPYGNQPPITYYTNDLDVYVQSTTPMEDAWILERETDGSFTPVIEVTNSVPSVFLGQSLTLTTNQVHSLIAGNWYVEVDFDGSNYMGNLVPNYAYAIGPSPVVTIPPDDQNIIWSATVISPNNRTAKVIFDASNSTDPFYLPMQYYWTIYTNMFFDPSAIMFTNTGVVVTNVLEVGVYYIGLQVNDSIANGLPFEFVVQVVTPGQAVDSFISDYLQTSTVPNNKKRILINTLSIAAAFFNRGQMARGVAKLEEYKRMVRAFHFDSTERSTLLQPVQDILDAFKVPERFKSFR